MVEDRKVYRDEYLMIDELKRVPHNVKTLIGNDFKGYATSDYKVCSRLINKLCKKGYIYQVEVPYNMFHKLLYYNPEKEYIIILYATRMGTEIFYVDKINKKNSEFIKVEGYNVLEKINWHNNKKSRFLRVKNIIKMI